MTQDKDELVQMIERAVMHARHTEVPRDLAGCYAIRSAVTGRIYIGRSENIRQRLIQHAACLKACEHPSATMQADYLAHGLAGFRFGVIRACEDQQERAALERALIEAAAAFDRYNTVVYEALTVAERQAAYKKRNEAVGLVRVPQLWAHRDDHAEIKAEAARLRALRGYTE